MGMLTEQEAVAKLNEKIEKERVSKETLRLLNKIKLLQDRLGSETSELNTIREKEKELESEILRIKGAISILLELAAENECMKDVSPTGKQT
jgi:hypothetical protein